MANENPVRTLDVAGLEVIKSGVADSGKAWTLYRVHVQDAAGNPIDGEFKSFRKLAEGPGDYHVETQIHEKFGTSYLLQPAAGTQAAPPVDLDFLHETVVSLLARVSALEGGVQLAPQGTDIPFDAPKPASAPADTDALPF